MKQNSSALDENFPLILMAGRHMDYECQFNDARP